MASLYDKIKATAVPITPTQTPTTSAVSLYDRVKQNTAVEKAPVQKVESPIKVNTGMAVSTPSAVISDSGFYKPLTDAGKAAGQGIARAWAATGARIAKTIGTAQTDEINPQTIFGNTIYGKALAETVFGTAKPFNATKEDADFLEAFGTDPQIAKGTGGSITMLLSVLDLTGSGGGAKGLAGAVRSLKLAKTAEEAAQVARGIGLAEDVVGQYAEIFAKSKTTKEVKEALEAAVNLQNTTKSKEVTALSGAKKSIEAPEVIAKKGEQVPIKKVVERPKITKAEYDKKLYELETTIENKAQVIQENPAKELQKYTIKETGLLPEGGIKTKGERGTKFEKTGDEIAANLGFKNTEEARTAFEEFKKQVDELKELKETLRDFKKQPIRKDADSSLAYLDDVSSQPTVYNEPYFGGKAVPIPEGLPNPSKATFVRNAETSGQTTKSVQETQIQGGQVKDPQPRSNITKANQLPIESETTSLPKSEPQTTKVVNRSDKKVELSDATYEENRTLNNTNKGRIERAKDGVHAAVKSIGESTDKVLGTISTRLKNIDPSLKKNIRDFEFKLANNRQEDRRAVEPFLKGIRDKSIDAADYADLDLALKNGDATKTDEILKKYNLLTEFGVVRTKLDELYERASSVGYDIGYEKNYFPRMLEDSGAFLEYLQKGDDWSVIDEAIKAKETEIGRYLTTNEKANVVNTLIRGYSVGKITLSKTGAMKLRTVDIVDAQLNQFYRDSMDSLLRYIDTTNDAIEARRFFGKGMPKTDEFANIEDSIGAYTLNLLVEKKIKPSQERELRDILQARFNQIGTYGAVRVYKNLSYIDTMGSFTSAITQIGDLAFAIYKGGPVQAAKAFGKAVVGKSEITRKDIGIEKIAQEFEDGSKSANLVSSIFKIIGLEKMDALGKETVINATIGRYRKLAADPDMEFMQKLEQVFDPEDVTQVIDDLKAGRNTENVRLLAFNELLDVQPVALSEMPEQYLKGGNGRIFYMLKTYTIKLFDVYRNEVFSQMRTNPVRATRNLVYLTGSLVAMNATADEIKDFILNRETSLSDRVVDNVLKLAGFSKFTIYKAREEGIGSAVAKTILPPFKFIDSVYKDITKQNELTELESIQSIPVAGKLYYWWFGKGAEKSAKKRKEASNVSSSRSSSAKTPAGLPKLPTTAKKLPTPPGLPKL